MTRRSAATARGVPSAIFSPKDSTMIRCERDMTARMLCSMRRTEIPPALMAPMSRTMASISVALSPAITSSSKRSVGSVASARASSSRLRSARVRREASSEARSTSATRSRTARAAASASAMAGWRASAATFTLSSTESRAKGRTIWKVRARPSRQMSCGLSPPRRRSRNRISPSSGARNPESRLKTVVFPAPLGPMRPTISPSATVRSSPSTARRPPKRLESPRTSSRLSARSSTIARGAPGSGALGQEEHHGDEERAVHDQMAARPAGGREVAPGELGERGEDEGAEDRPQRRARAAHDRTDDDLHGKRDAEERAGLERELIEGVEGPADPREEGGEHARDQLAPEGVDAEGLGRLLVLPDGDQVGAEARLLQPPHDDGGAGHQDERDVVVGPGVLKLELGGIARERDEEPDRAAHCLGVQRDDPADFGEGHGEKHEVEAAQPEAEAQVANDGAQQRCRGCAHEHADPGGKAHPERQDGSDVGADAHEGRVAGGELSRVSPEDVPGLAQVGVEEDQGEEGDRVRTDEGRQSGEGGQGEREGPEPHATLPPKRPAGLKRRIKMSREKETSSFNDGERNTAPRDSATATRRPPRKAPGRLPIPPMMTMLNDVTLAPSPTEG